MTAPHPQAKPAASAQRAAIPDDLADVALTDARTAAAAGCMSVSWWHAEVLAGRAPQPVMRGVRCTRWRVADVREFWRLRVAAPAPAEAAPVTTQAKRASEAAQAKRRAHLAQVGA